jgi:hypothetical protein
MIAIKKLLVTKKHRLIMMRSVFVVIGLLMLTFGCLFQPYSEDVNLTKKTGCEYSEPACSENYSCVNNTCILSSGCAYNNPACLSNETCVNNSCILAPGCAYNNPACEADYNCINNSCIEKIICGKFGCQASEQSTCCQDCGCPQDEICDQSGICLVNGSNVEMSNLKVNSHPPVVLHSVQPKTIEQKAGPLASITVTNRGTLKAYNVNLRSEVLGFSGSRLYELGTLAPMESRVINLTQLLYDDVLELENGTTTKFKVLLDYKAAGKTHTDKTGANIHLPNRNTFDWRIPQAMAAWVDPTDRTIINFANDATQKSEIITDTDRLRASRQVYNHIKSFGVEYSANGKCYNDSLKFPTETLRDKSGDCADISVLYAAAIEAAGVRSVLIKNDDTILSGYAKLDGTIVPLDLREIKSQNFEDATASGSELVDSSSQIYYPQDLWATGTYRLNLGIDVLTPDIVTTSSNCVLLSDEFKVNYWFENKGYNNGMRCLKAVLYQSNIDTEYFSKRVCVDVPKLQSRNVTFNLYIPKSVIVTNKCWID